MSSLVKRSFSLAGHRTSVALEPEFWTVLTELAAAEQLTLAGLVLRLDSQRIPSQPLASLLRVHALTHRA
jgi:predicted DNA-binding ribbon-helix-helix protein